MIDAGELVREDGEGARRPLPEVFAELAPRLRRLAARRVGENLADDVVQETFLRACRAYDRYVEDGRSWAWVRNIAEHVCIDLVRRSRTEAAAVERVCSYRQAWAADDTVASVEAREKRETMASVLAQLQPRQRRVLVLRDFHGWSNREVALALDMTIEGVKATLKRARSAFRVAYATAAEGRYVAAVLGAIAAVRRTLRRGTTASAGSVNVVLVSALVVVTTLSLNLPVLPFDPERGGDGGEGGVARSTSTQRAVGGGSGGPGRAGGFANPVRSGLGGGAGGALAPASGPAAGADTAGSLPRSGSVFVWPPDADAGDTWSVPRAPDSGGGPGLEVGTDISPTCGIAGMEATCAPLDTKVVVPVPEVEKDSTPTDVLPVPLPNLAGPASRMSLGVPSTPLTPTNRSGVTLRLDQAEDDAAEAAPEPAPAPAPAPEGETSTSTAPAPSTGDVLDTSDGVALTG